jgi:hypothetical protein
MTIRPEQHASVASSRFRRARPLGLERVDQSAWPRGLPVLFCTLGGAVSGDIHYVVQECVNERVSECAEEVGRPCGIQLVVGQTWVRYLEEDPGEFDGEKFIATRDAARVKREIDGLVQHNGGASFDGALLVVGKSSGGALAWNTFRLHWPDIAAKFRRYAAVLVDPHGAVLRDGRGGPYCHRQDLWWPDGWEEDQRVFRVYNIFQHNGDSEGYRHRGAIENIKYDLTGASFPDRRVWENKQLHDGDVNHMNITRQPRTREMIKDAFRFAHRGW